MDDFIDSEFERHKYEYDTLYNKIYEYLKGDYHQARIIDAVAFENTNIVFKMFPEIKAQQKDGLIPFDILEPVLPGIYKYGEFLIFAHRFLRRNYSLSDKMNYDFLREFEHLNHEGFNLFIALDCDLIGLAGTEQELCERAYYYGPYFNDDMPKISIGVTQYIDENYNELLPGIKLTQFYWYEQENKRKFQCEEVNLQPYGEDEIQKFNCRYVHSILDKNARYLEHLDGAIRSYSNMGILEREKKSIASIGRNASYKKLWRVDGNIDVLTWKELIADYYKDNFMVAEYLSGEGGKN